MAQTDVAVEPDDGIAGLGDARVRRVEIVISVLLRAGVVTSLVIVLVGTVMTFVHNPAYTSSHADLDGLIGAGARFPDTAGEVARGVRHGDGPAVVIAGLLVLIATPVVRVAVSIFAFLYQRDRTFVAITSVVLALLLVSFAVGRAAG